MVWAPWPSCRPRPCLAKIKLPRGNRFPAGKVARSQFPVRRIKLPRGRQLATDFPRGNRFGETDFPRGGRPATNVPRGGRPATKLPRGNRFPARRAARNRFPAGKSNSRGELGYQDAYKEVTGEDAEIQAVHAGVECGTWAILNPDLDMISVGPDISGAHTPEETLCLDSLVKVWRVLEHVLVSLGRPILPV